MKICANCQFNKWGTESGPYCESPQRDLEVGARVYQQVHGGPLRLKWMLSTEARSDDRLCGEDARWFVEQQRSWLARKWIALTGSAT